MESEINVDDIDWDDIPNDEATDKPISGKVDDEDDDIDDDEDDDELSGELNLLLVENAVKRNPNRNLFCINSS